MDNLEVEYRLHGDVCYVREAADGGFDRKRRSKRRGRTAPLWPSEMSGCGFGSGADERIEAQSSRREERGRTAMTISRRKKLIGLTVAAGLLAVSAAFAGTAGSPLPGAVQRLLDCRTVAPDAARLACYDRAVNELGRLLAAGEIVVVDKERVATVKRQAFGFTLPSLTVFDRGDKPAELAEISAVASRAWRQGDGRWAVELEDGAVWAQTDDERMDRDPHAGSNVQIKKAAMSSYFMKVDGQRALRARRVR
jgi:hypothetical protein